MAKKLDSMDIKQIIALHLEGLSNRKIGSLLGISRNTVNEYILRIKASGWSPKALLEMDSKSIDACFPSATTIDNARFDTLMKFFGQVNEARKHPGFTFLYHYLQYRTSCVDPYSYTQFMEHYHRKYAHIESSMKLAHDPGNEVFLDFAGKKLHIVDRDTGQQIPVEVFVAILPCSHYTYAEACMSQKREDLVPCIGHGFDFFNGVTRAIVSDNLKSAVSRASKYEPEINRSLKELAIHYGCVINPTRSYSPQDKALVENAVNLVYQRIYHPIRNMVFFSLRDLNKEIAKWLEVYNDQLLQRKGISRKELFQSVERSYLKPLPQTEYQLKDYRRAKVQKMGYVYFSADKNYYSVPYRFIGKQTQIHYSKSMVEVYYNHERIAIHKRSPLRGAYITNKDHLSSTHQQYLNWNADYFKNLAAKHGTSVLSFITALLEGGDYPEVNYKRAMGIIQLARKYGSEQLDKACQRASCTDVYSYKMIQNILENNLQNQQLDLFDLESTKPHIPGHENIRGASAYQ